LTFPVARYQRFSGAGDLSQEMERATGPFIRWAARCAASGTAWWRRRKPLIALVANLSYRKNLRQSQKNCRDFLAVLRRVDR
jgi:hypothetical protein